MPTRGVDSAVVLCGKGVFAMVTSIMDAEPDVRLGFSKPALREPDWGSFQMS